MQIQRFAELLDQQSQIVLEGHAGQKGLVDLFGAESGDPEDDEVKGIGLARLDFEQKLFGGGKLREAAVVGREGKLPTQISDLIDPELRHEGYYPSGGDIGQGESDCVENHEGTRWASPAAKECE